MKNLLLKIFAAIYILIVITSCRTVQKTAHAEKTFDYEETTTIEYGDTMLPFLTKENLLHKMDSIENAGQYIIPGTRITIVKKGRLQTKDTATVKRADKISFVSDSQIQAEQKSGIEDTTKHVSGISWGAILSFLPIAFIVIAPILFWKWRKEA